MPYLTPNYLARYERLRAFCFDEFENRVERPGLTAFDVEEFRLAWRHADILLAAFPRVRRRPGFDILCWFTQGDPNCISRLIGYAAHKPNLVPDPFDVATTAEEPREDLLLGTADGDGKILLIPEMPKSFQPENTEAWPDWLCPDINAVIEDDDTPEGIYERAQLLLWSRGPINRWHSIGFGNHSLVTEFPTTTIENMMPCTGDGAAPAPSDWLPRVDIALRPADIDWAVVPVDQAKRFAEKPVKVVRFYTYTDFLPERIEETTVWITADHWHVQVRTVFQGEGGKIA